MPTTAPSPSRLADAPALGPAPGPGAAGPGPRRMPLPLVRPDPPAARLTRLDRAGLGLLAALAVGFGGLVVVRSALQTDRKTDLGVYARAGFAVRAGEDLYKVWDDRGWHYCYPPPFAVVMAPLADPWPWTTDRAGYLPFAATAAIWYALSVGLLAYAVHALAGAVLPGEPRGSRRWWYARTVPAVVCLGGVGATLSRGQVNILVVALVAGMFAAAVRGRAVAAGAWLAAAACLKVIPGFLVLFPAVRRDWRAGVGVAVGGVLLLGALPAAVWGVDGAVGLNREFAELVIRPGTTGHGDQTRAKELTDTTGTDSQSFQAVIHNLRHPDKGTRPRAADKPTRLAHLAVAGALTVATVVVGWRRLRPAPGDQLVFLGCLSAVMLLSSPASHMHYYVFALPLAAGLWLRGMAARPGAPSADRRTVAVLVAWGVLTAVPLFPGAVTDRLREAGFGTLATVGLWAVGLAAVARRPAGGEPAAVLGPVRLAA